MPVGEDVSFLISTFRCQNRGLRAFRATALFFLATLFFAFRIILAIFLLLQLAWTIFFLKVVAICTLAGEVVSGLLEGGCHF